MASLSITAIRPLNRWDYDSIRPGGVGSVGDALQEVQYRRSNSDMKPIFKAPCPYVGSNITDGNNPAMARIGMTARTEDSAWYNRNFKVARGWIYQDLKAVDRQVLPKVGYTPQQGWRELVAQTFNAGTTGESFAPLPGGYQLRKGQVPRGNSMPIVSVEGNVVSANDLGNRYYNGQLSSSPQYGQQGQALLFGAPGTTPSAGITPKMI